MAVQTFKNHTRWDPLYHFVLTPLSLILLIGCTRSIFHWPDIYHVGLLISAICILLLTAIVRQYSLKVQTRMIRLEEQARLHRLMPAEPAVVEGLSIDQLVGIRFASDSEAPALARRAILEKLDRKSIKQAVQIWRPDEFRV